MFVLMINRIIWKGNTVKMAGEWHLFHFQKFEKFWNFGKKLLTYWNLLLSASFEYALIILIEMLYKNFKYMLTLESRRFPVLGEVFLCIRTLPNRWVRSYYYIELIRSTVTILWHAWNKCVYTVTKVWNTEETGDIHANPSIFLSLWLYTYL